MELEGKLHALILGTIYSVSKRRAAFIRRLKATVSGL